MLPHLLIGTSVTVTIASIAILCLTAIMDNEWLCGLVPLGLPPLVEFGVFFNIEF